MKYLALAAIALLAMAQTSLPVTTNMVDNATGKVIGVLTQVDNRVTVRSPEGEFYATIIINADGTRIAYDENGKEMSRVEPKAK